MPKRTKLKSRYIKKGGLIDAAPQSYPPTTPSSSFNFNTWMSGVQQSASSVYNKAKDAANSATIAATSAANSATRTLNETVNPTPPPPRMFGGKKRRKARGGTLFSWNNLVATASPISGILSAKPQVLVGGKTRKRSCNKHSKSCKCKGKTYKKGNRKNRAKTMKFPFSKSLKRLIKM